MFVELINTKHVGKVGEFCGRGSPIGNPYPKGPNRTRDEACDLYFEWFHLQIHNGNPYVLDYLLYLLDKLEREGRVRLRCFCAPRRCHTETIRDWLIENAYPPEDEF